MKKISLSFIFVLFFVSLVGCFSASTISSIELVEQPRTTYYVGDPIGSFSIKLIYSDGREPLVISSTNSAITVENFSTSTAGTFTAQIKYISSEYTGAPISFQYTVVNLNEISGSGTEADPYLISSVEQWNQMDTKGEGKFFRLTNDIDFSGQPIKQFATDKVLVNGTQVYFSATIDGAGYTLRNIDEVLQTEYSKYQEIFGVVKDFKLKNINIIFASNSRNGATGLVTDGYGTVTFEKVNTYGFIAGAQGKVFSNVGAFVAQAGRKGADVVYNFNECKNYADILGGLGANAGGFVGYADHQAGALALNFNSCYNYGMVEGASDGAGGFIGQFDGSAQIKATNCKNYGDVLNLSEAGLFGVNKLDESGTFVNTGFVGTSDMIKEVDSISVDADTRKITKKEGFTYVISYYWVGTYLGGGSSGIRFNLPLGDENTFELINVYFSVDSSILSQYDEVEFESDLVRKYVHKENKSVIFTCKSLQYQDWNTQESNSITVTILEYNAEGKLSGYISKVKKYNSESLKS